MKVAIGSDHCGYKMKVLLRPKLERLGCEISDYGCYSTNPVDFPDIVRKVSEALRDNKHERAIIVCGTGVGAAIAANKIPGIRAAVCHDSYSAHQCVEHDDVNVMCVGAQIIGLWLAEELAASFIKARFSTEDHFRRRVNKLHHMEHYYAKELLNR